jgi:hypothetical protein
MVDGKNGKITSRTPSTASWNSAALRRCPGPWRCRCHWWRQHWARYGYRWVLAVVECQQHSFGLAVIDIGLYWAWLSLFHAVLGLFLVSRVYTVVTGYNGVQHGREWWWMAATNSQQNLTHCCFCSSASSLGTDLVVSFSGPNPSAEWHE